MFGASMCALVPAQQQLVIHSIHDHSPLKGDLTRTRTSGIANKNTMTALVIQGGTSIAKIGRRPTKSKGFPAAVAEVSSSSTRCTGQDEGGSQGILI
jgi:hypothetical protein